MQCEKCGQAPAVVHVTDIVNKKKLDRYLCEACYGAAGNAMPIPSKTLADILAQTVPVGAGNLKSVFSDLLAASSRSTVSKRCDLCGMTFDEVQKRGVLGCPNDYEVFAEELAPLLQKLHGAKSHSGKVPKDIETLLAREHQINQLQNELKTAVGAEKFEEAAKLRDRIRALESKRGRTP